MPHQSLSISNDIFGNGGEQFWILVAFENVPMLESIILRPEVFFKIGWIFSKVRDYNFCVKKACQQNVCTGGFFTQILFLTFRGQYYLIVIWI